jgi:hypothetical protein
MADTTATSSKNADRERRELERAQLPAIYVDTWASLAWKDHIRIILGEGFRSGPQYRAAFVMTWADAELLGSYLLETVAEQREKDASTKESDS